MPRGEVKWFDNRRGWGFLRLDDGSEIFVHHGDLEGRGYRSLEAGQRIECELAQGERGPRAIAVRPA